MKFQDFGELQAKKLLNLVGMMKDNMEQEAKWWDI